MSLLTKTTPVNTFFITQWPSSRAVDHHNLNTMSRLQSFSHNEQFISSARRSRDYVSSSNDNYSSLTAMMGKYTLYKSAPLEEKKCEP